MKKLIFFLFFVPSIAFAQKSVEVNAGTAKINGTRYPGFKTKIVANAKELETFLKKDLKSMGKSRERSSYFSVTEMTLEDIYYKDRFFYAELNRGDGIHGLWVGVDSTGLKTQDWQLVSNALEDYTYQFAIRFYKWEVQQEIDESLKAEAFAIKTQSKLEKETKELASKLSDNERDLVRLQKAIEDNKAKHIELLQKIEDNKSNKITAASDLVKIREVIAIQKKKHTAIK